MIPYAHEKKERKKNYIYIEEKKSIRRRKPKETMQIWSYIYSVFGVIFFLNCDYFSETKKSLRVAFQETICLDMGAQALNRKSIVSRTGASTGVLEEYDSNGASGPPRIVAILSSALEKCIQKNEKRLKASSQKEVITVFHGSRAPALSIRQYIERIFKYSNCSPSCFVVAYIYLERFLHQMDIHLTSLNVHRLLITSFMLAVKFVEDECYNNAYYAKIGGITTAEINKLEMKFLVSTDFRMHVSVETFDAYCSQLEEEAMEKCRIERTFRICGWGKSFTNKDGSNHGSRTAGYNTCRAT